MWSYYTCKLGKRGVCHWVGWHSTYAPQRSLEQKPTVIRKKCVWVRWCFYGFCGRRGDWHFPGLAEKDIWINPTCSQQICSPNREPRYKATPSLGGYWRFPFFLETACNGNSCSHHGKEESTDLATPEPIVVGTPSWRQRIRHGKWKSLTCVANERLCKLWKSMFNISMSGV